MKVYCFRMVFLSSLLLLFSHGQAQQKSEKINESIQNTAKALKDIFHHKKNSAEAAGNTQTSNSTSVKAGSGLTLTPKPGQLATNAKSLDVDQIQPFDGGAAVVLKGSSSALIDSAGKLVVPFNKYQIMFETQTGFLPGGVHVNPGFFQFVSPNRGFLNAKGKVVVQDNDRYLFNYTNDKTMLVSSQRITGRDKAGRSIDFYRLTYATPGGHKYVFDGGINNVNKGIGIIQPPGMNGLSYSTLDGRRITTDVFDEANSFSDGMALVGKVDQFGKMKYGFINREGKLVIPYQFSIRPGDFHAGYARVEPLNQSSFKYAYINKKGEVAFKQTDEDVKKYGTLKNFHDFGMAFSGSYFLTTDFKLIPIKDFFISYGIPADSWFSDNNLQEMEGEKNPKLFFRTRKGIDPVTHQGALTGFINLTTKKVVMPAFYKIGLFDPVSHLAYAEADIGKDKNGLPVFRKGYVNEDGLFVLILGQGSTW